ncbi:DarT ssDNA thymidine ADP-ribosyltransferase family protein [Cupriavidus pauculus]|uniref:DarT ssDNA thymidine ADP-ribosyltransferase family protein n=1 Tax=Cupriavidus pauculus TaxID=82633 RepID=UPI00283A8B75|nr:DarT ssDNA thymidine ADP-ribosyltransferase family protein [Cupriavidus pauculus]
MPVNPKIYHIVHVDRLGSIIANGGLWCDARVVRDGAAGTTMDAHYALAKTIRRRAGAQSGVTSRSFKETAPDRLAGHP